MFNPWRPSRLPPRALAGLVVVTSATVLFTALFSADHVSTLKVAAQEASARERCDRGEHFDLGRFSDPTRIDNKYLPLIPGTRFVFEGLSNRGEGLLPHQVVFTVTDLTKVINGVRTLVVYDVDTNAGQLVEEEIAFFAQDDAGNVWKFGQHPEEYEGLGFLGAGSTWIEGMGTAEAGMHMRANPVVGTPSYHQGFVPDISFYDCAVVAPAPSSLCGALGCFTDIVLIEEWDPLSGDNAIQLKYHAPGFGIVRIEAIEDPEGETLELTAVERLSVDEMIEVRRNAMRLDENARWLHPFYRLTAPLEGLP